MIPCLGVLILNRPDLLLRMVDSIDVSVERLCIVQNSGGEDIDAAIQDISGGRNPLIDKVYVERPFRNCGVAPAWNSIIKSFPECDYWLIANNDTVFLPGDLAKYHELYQHNAEAVIVAANGAFNCFLITPLVVSRVGLFDENIWPIYHEDIDYYTRMQRAGIQRIPIPSAVGWSNDGSWTIKSDTQYQANNTTTQHENGVYVEEKWGKNLEFATPWNHPARHWCDWWYNPYRRQLHSSIWNNFENTANRTK